ncbi:MAG TPA: TonB-dependent receptor, partial [Flavobacterium sp.]|nr:TonB-dependent receptor [Flavobacterium sp.]
QNTMRWNSDENAYTIVRQARSDNHRYFHELNEKEIAVNASVDYKFAKTADDSYKGKLIVGYNGRFKKRSFDAVQFNYQINSTDLVVQPNQVDQIFNQENMDAGLFKLVTFRGDGENALEPQYYNGDSKIHAGFAVAEYQLSPKLFAVLGLRYEHINQVVDWKTQLDNYENSNELNKNAVLPNLNLKYELSGTQNLRLAASKTYTLPQFKERAKFLYEDVDETIFGNEYLYASDNYNLDLKWEFFPQNDEVVSATLFGKYIQNPINTTNIASSSNDITYINTGDWGYAIGIELELRKNLVYFNNDDNNKLSFGINAAYMKTNQELNAKKVARENPGLNVNFTHSEAKFTGASEFLGNADVTYFKSWNDKNIMATFAYNYNSDRVYALGNEQKGNLVDKGFGMLDFIFKTKFNENFGMGISAKNLLNPSIDRVQENLDQDHLVRSYKLGSTFSISLNYNF